MKSIMIRPVEEWQVSAIDRAKEIASEKTATKALLKMPRIYDNLSTENQSLRDRIETLEQRLGEVIRLAESHTQELTKLMR